MRAAAYVLLALSLAGCAEPTALEDGRAFVYVVNAGEPAFVALRDENGDLAWTGRLLPREAHLVEVHVREGGCLGFTLLAGYDGAEPEIPVRLVTPCDGDAAPTRLEFERPAPRPG